MENTLLIPIFEPDERNFPFIEATAHAGFSHVVIVNDGSGVSYEPFFQKVAKLPNVSIVSYPNNQGKGHALKAGLSFIRESFPDVQGVVTADGDGQHRLADIQKVGEALSEHPDSLIMGVRSFTKDAPWANRAGNRFSALYFRLLTHKSLSDTQTGLRGIPASLFDLALESQGERYDYEMNFLMAAAREAPIAQVNIATVYEPHQTTHFRKFADSVRIYRVPLLYVAVALLSSAIDLSIFTLISAYADLSTVFLVLGATVGARLISGAFNFSANYYLVFRHEGRLGRQLAKYLIVFFVNMGLSFGLTYAFSYLPSHLTFVKFVVDFILFVLNFLVSASWIFVEKHHRKSQMLRGAAPVAKHHD